MTKVIRINMSGTWQLGIGASGVLGLKGILPKNIVDCQITSLKV